MAQNFENWNEDNDPTSFVPRFLEKYRTSVLIDIWANKLINCQQGPTESVDSYATRMYELYRRLEADGNQYPAADKVRRFMGGLRYELQVAVRPFRDNTWDNVVNRAKSCELGTQSTSLFANVYANNNSNIPNLGNNAYFTNNSSNTDSSVLNAIQTLTKQLEKLENKVN